VTETNDLDPELDMGIARFDDAGAEPDRPAGREPLLPEPLGWTDALTGTEGPRYWDRLVTGEQARVRRYRPSVTIVMFELSGFETAAGRLGRAAALQKFAQISRALASEVRSSDHIARIAPSRFGLVLVETNELEALNFIDRTLGHLRTAIANEQLEVHVGVGWASPEAGAQLSQAIATAEHRLATDFFHTR
jgi:diguanylate cyclase (GGDEF)-like protein